MGKLHMPPPAPCSPTIYPAQTQSTTYSRPDPAPRLPHPSNRMSPISTVGFATHPRENAGNNEKKQAQRRRLLDARYPKGIDFSCGAMRISAPPSLSLTELESASASGGTSSGGVRGAQTVGEVLPFWRPWTVALMVRTGATQRLQQAVR